MLFNNLAQTDAHFSVVERSVTIGIESHAQVFCIRGGCAEVGRLEITTPEMTLLVTIVSETRHKEAREERSITDQQLIGVCTAHGPHTVPQSICICTLPIITCSRHGLVGFWLEIGLVTSLMINEDDFRELQ